MNESGCVMKKITHPSTLLATNNYSKRTVYEYVVQTTNNYFVTFYRQEANKVCTCFRIRILNVYLVCLLVSLNWQQIRHLGMTCHGWNWKLYVLIVCELIPTDEIEREWWHSGRLGRRSRELGGLLLYKIIRNSCCGGTPALLSCLRKYSHLLALDTMVLMWIVKDKLASYTRSDALNWNLKRC